MGKRLRLEPHLATAELERRYRAAKDPHERSWWQILWLLAIGHTAAAVAEVTGYSRYWIGQLVRRYNTQGPAGMHNRQHTTSWRAQPMLSGELQEELRQALKGRTPEGARRWTARAVAAWMSSKLGRPVRVQRAGTTCSASSTARNSLGPSTRWPARTNKPPSKKLPTLAKGGRDRLPGGHRRGVGDG